LSDWIAYPVKFVVGTLNKKSPLLVSAGNLPKNNCASEYKKLCYFSESYAIPQGWAFNNKFMTGEEVAK
jgi:hypothetical protein